MYLGTVQVMFTYNSNNSKTEHDLNSTESFAEILV